MAARVGPGSMPQFKLTNELARLAGHNVLGRPRMSPRNVIVYWFQKRRNVWRRPVPSGDHTGLSLLRGAGSVRKCDERFIY